MAKKNPMKYFSGSTVARLPLYKLIAGGTAVLLCAASLTLLPALAPERRGGLWSAAGFTASLLLGKTLPARKADNSMPQYP